MKDLDLMCTNALQRIKYFINRSAGQHLRAMRSTVGAPAAVDAPSEPWVELTELYEVETNHPWDWIERAHYVLGWLIVVMCAELFFYIGLTAWQLVKF